MMTLLGLMSRWHTSAWRKKCRAEARSIASGRYCCWESRPCRRIRLESRGPSTCSSTTCGRSPSELVPQAAHHDRVVGDREGQRPRVRAPRRLLRVADLVGPQQLDHDRRVGDLVEREVGLVGEPAPEQPHRGQLGGDRVSLGQVASPGRPHSVVSRACCGACRRWCCSPSSRGCGRRDRRRSSRAAGGVGCGPFRCSRRCGCACRMPASAPCVASARVARGPDRCRRDRRRRHQHHSGVSSSRLKALSSSCDPRPMAATGNASSPAATRPGKAEGSRGRRWW